MKLITALVCVVSVLSACSPSQAVKWAKPQKDLLFSGETHLSNLKQLTFSGTNAEAYWSYDGKHLTFQHQGSFEPLWTENTPACDQIYRLDLQAGSFKDAIAPISNPKSLTRELGRTTCAFYYPDDKRVLFSSTKAYGPSCPAAPDKSRGYVWPIYDTYQIFTSKPDGTDVFPIEPTAPKAYNAETTTCSDGSVVFTSDRDGDLELYTAKLDTLGTIKDIKRITQEIGYDGGAVFSPDCKKIAWRASRPRPGKELEDYQSLLRQHLVRPGALEIWVANADGSQAHQVTNLGAASFAPGFTPDGKSILFSANVADPRGRRFDIFKIDLNGSGLEQITHSGSFDAFPMFSPDGKHLAFSSNRGAKNPRDTNVFVADWTDHPARELTLDDAQPADRAMAMIQALSSDTMEGRGVETEGMKRATQLVVDRFTKLGLRPVLGGSFLNPVQIQSGVKTDPEQTSLKLGSRALELSKDFVVLGFSSSGAIRGQVVDAGYGLMIPEKGVQDFKKEQLKGKIALIRRHVPKGLGLKPEEERRYGDLYYKAYLARENGAAGVIFWEADQDLEDRLSDLAADRPGLRDRIGAEVGIPALAVARAAAQHTLVMGAVPMAQGSVTLSRKEFISHNVLGMTENCGPKSRPVLIGAHLDHLGYGTATSLSDSHEKKIHPGADDNASGVAGMLEAARILTKTSKACFAFAAFTGEESGVIGSSQLVSSLKKSGIKVKAMLNLDMVGRMLENKLLVFGTESAREWPEWVRSVCADNALKCSGGGDGYGPSDHMPFYMAGIPVLHFFTGPHADYHRPSDQAHLINATGVVQVARAVAAIADRSARAGSVTFLMPKGSSSMMKPVSSHGGGSGDQRSFGAYLGTIPDYATMASPHGPGQDSAISGVKLAGARPGSPAEKAGVQTGDILVGIDSKNIKNLEEFMYVLQTLKPDQAVTLKVKRGNQTLDLPATVGRKN